MDVNKWIEIISVRLCEPNQRQTVKAVFNQVKHSIAHDPAFSVTAELYVNRITNTDWSIYLHWNHQEVTSPQSLLGMGIAEAFSSLGLVDHSAWTNDIVKKETDYGK